MDRTKSGKKKVHNKNQKPETASVSNKYVNWREVDKKTSGQGKMRHTGQQKHTEQDEHKYKKRGTSSEQDTAEEKCYSKESLRQEKTHMGDLDEIWQETNVGQNFEILAKAPISTGHFEFKSEKNWMLEASKYDEFFTVDVKNLAAAMNCIPFNQLIDLDNTYFTKDELTDINNTAEQAKKDYDDMLKSLRKENLESELAADRLPESEKIASCSNNEHSLQSTRLTNEVNPDSKSIEEDLDFLLSLKEPQPVTVNVSPLTNIGPNEIKPKNIPAATKSIDLEKWLDSVLGD